MISLVNEYVVLLDACVLLPISLTDLLLRLAEDPAFYSPRWSRDILREVERNLQLSQFGRTVDQAAFPEAMVAGYEAFVEKMENDEKDRHVLAAAVRAKADAIVTSNTRDFPVRCLEPFGIERLTPDQFLLRQWHLDSKLLESKLRDQAEDGGRSLERLLTLLGKLVPKFVDSVRDNGYG